MKPAKDYDHALEIAMDNLPPFDESDSAIHKISVDKKVDVLINHKGKVPTQLIKGWDFKFKKNDSGWELINSEER